MLKLMYVEMIMRAQRKERWMGSGETEFRLLFQGRDHLRGPWGMSRSLPEGQVREGDIQRHYTFKDIELKDDDDVFGE